MNRVGPIDLAQVLKAPNPTIDLHFESFHKQTGAFLTALRNYADRARTQIGHRRDTFNAERAKLADRRAHIETDTNDCKVREIELAAQLEKEAKEKKEAEAAVAAWGRRLAALKEACAASKAEIDQYSRINSTLEHEKGKERSTLNSHAKHVVPELAACQKRLHATIEGVQQDRLLVRFTHIDELDLDREYNFVLDVASSDYKVLTSNPYLPEMLLLVEELNRNRDISAFIKHMRQLFCDSTRGR